jgi:hypothetical protein
MTQTNSDILRSFIDEVTNQKRLDLMPKYLSKKYIAHGTPYVGMGIMSDDTHKDKIIIKTLYQGSPAEGKLIVGDEILRVFDGERTWKTYEELREGLWGHGVIGTPVTIWVRRNNVEQEVTVVRGLIKSYEFTYQDVVTIMPEVIKDWPDLTTHLVNVIEAGEIVAYHAENQGHNVRYGRSAAWAEFGMVRIQDGKITDWWAVEDTYTQFKQLGYTIHEPALAKV